MADSITTRLRELMEEATPGPWTVDSAGFVRNGKTVISFDAEPSEDNCEAGWSDSELIALLLNNAPTIIRLLEAGDGMEGALAEFVRIDDEHYLQCRDGGDLVSALHDARSALATLRAAREGAR